MGKASRKKWERHEKWTEEQRKHLHTSVWLRKLIAAAKRPRTTMLFSVVSDPTDFSPM